jgi:hypothetical protein
MAEAGHGNDVRPGKGRVEVGEVMLSLEGEHGLGLGRRRDCMWG